MALELPPEERLTAGDLIAEVADKSPDTGPNTSVWPGLTFYRFTRPQPAQWSMVESLSLCCVLQGSKRVVVDGQEFRYDPFSYLVFTGGTHYETQVLEAGVEKPFLSFVLQIGPGLVRSVLSEMADPSTTAAGSAVPNPGNSKAYVSPVDQNLMGAVLRFLRSLTANMDRRVLAPTYLHEITYRLMREAQVARLVDAATTEQDTNPVSEVIRYVRERMSEPLTVADLAHRVRLSQTTLSTVFAEATGMTPYQFVKRMRLDEARVLLLRDDVNVGEAARSVGYTSLSHFINEFKRYYGTTPRAYAATQRRNMGAGPGETYRRSDFRV
ncbi:AraC family transcriptional regulator [Pseudonocardia endophytica]|uniref:AraC-like DNA-binding protein n=1 Tax=Pseudonocardia endophytica TaxID=401976 RepID=A0A4R1HYV3_PSEEN|nr:AraC family transcriptional regulator [Pseudonocardia endophytica]TCK26753.1 AraC-like DNA-binding protein [Pseudonocardia endophytica]